jgi:hypothetical protein
MVAKQEFSKLLQLLDEESHEYMEESFDKLRSFKKEEIKTFFQWIADCEYFREAIANHKLSIEEGVNLAGEMNLADNEDDAEVIFVQKMYINDGCTFEGIYKDTEDYGWSVINDCLNFDNLPNITSYINAKGFAEDRLNSVDFQTHEDNGRLLVFRA